MAKLQVEVTADTTKISNSLKKVVNETKKGFDSVWISVEKSLTEIARSIPGIFGRIVDEILSAFVRIKRQLSETFSRKVEVKGGAEGAGGGATAGLGFLAKSLGVIASVAIMAGTAIAILKMIDDKMKKQLEKLSEASPSWKGTLEMIKKVQSMVLKPIGDFISILARPYLMLMMNIMRQSLAKARAEVLVPLRTGAITPQEATERLNRIFASTYLALVPVQRSFQDLIRPVLGFTTAFEAIIGTTEDLKDAVQNFLQFILGAGSSLGTLFDRKTWEEAVEYLKKAFNDVGSKGEDLTSIFEDIKKKFEEQAGGLKVDTTPLQETIDDLKNKTDNLADDVAEADQSTENYNNTVNEQTENFINSTQKNKSIFEEIINFFKNQLLLTIPMITSFRGAIASVVSWINEKVSWISSKIEEAKSAISGFFSKLLGGGTETRQAGGFIPDTGLYLLHRGEYVLPQGRVSTTGFSVVKPNITINVQRIDSEYDIRKLADDLSRELQYRLRGKVETIGGV